MSTISIQEIQRDPMNFLRRIHAGEVLLLLSEGHMIAEVRPLAISNELQKPYGLCEGQFTVPSDFDDPLPEQLLRDFESS